MVCADCDECCSGCSYGLLHQTQGCADVELSGRKCTCAPPWYFLAYSLPGYANLCYCCIVLNQDRPIKGTSKRTVLLNKRIIVGICGGIASYKAVELVSRLQQAGALVDVIMTEHAEDFVRPLTFATMSHRPVYSDLWEASGRAAELHIGLAEEGELLAPAMYRDMYTHPATQANLTLLRERGAYIVEPEVGRLASGAVGPGRLPETTVLLGAVSMVLGRNGELAGRRVVVTAGGTQEPIDPVRYVGNRSS